MEGNGKTSPFGNGQGGARTMGASKGVDFTKQPAGSGGGGGPRPRDLTQKQVPARRAIQATEVSDLAADTVPEGGLLPFAQSDGSEVPGNPRGVGSIGNGAKPFRVDGGG